MVKLSSEAQIRLVDLAITIAASEIPKLIGFFKSLGAAGQMTAEQIMLQLDRADTIDDAVIAAARKALGQT
jgi:hypothetical protein